MLSWFLVDANIWSGPNKCSIDILTHIGSLAGCEGQLYEMPVEKLYKACLKADIKLIVNGVVVDTGSCSDESMIAGVVVGDRKFEHNNYRATA